MSIPFSRILCRSAALIALFAGPLSAAETPKEIVLKSAPFRAAITAKAAFYPVHGQAVQISPKQWKAIALEDIAAHGTVLKKGDSIARFEIDELKHAVAEASLAHENEALALEREERALDSFKKSAELDREDASRAAAEAEADLDRWLKISRPIEEEDARREVLSAEQQLAYAKEELRQLEHMYKADDLTEETEEIILQRSRWAVDRAEFALRYTGENTQKTLDVTLPRAEQKLRDTVARTALALKKEESDFALALQAKELALKQLRQTFEHNQRQLGEWRADLAQLENVRADADGILLWGDWTHPNGPTSHTEMEKKLTTNMRSAILPYEVFATLVPQSSALQIRAAISATERDALVKAAPDSRDAGFVPYILPDTAPGQAMAVKLSHLAEQPDPQGRFELTLDIPESPATRTILSALRPGTSGIVVLSEYSRLEAIVIPEEYVKTTFHPENGLSASLLIKASGENKTAPEWRTVKIGRQYNGQIELLEGAKTGEIALPIP